MHRVLGLLIVVTMTSGGCAAAEAPQWCCKETTEYGGVVGTNGPYGHMRCMKGRLPNAKLHDADCNCPEACWCWAWAAKQDAKASE